MTDEQNAIGPLAAAAIGLIYEENIPVNVLYLSEIFLFTAVFLGKKFL